jgi:hypothetical protein
VSINAAINEPSVQFIVILAAIWIPTLALIGGVMFGIRYIVSARELIIKIGPITERSIPVDDIWTLERSYNPSSSPANALRRLRIVYRQGVVLISPAHEKDFLKYLTSINPKVKLLNLTTE